MHGGQTRRDDDERTPISFEDAIASSIEEELAGYDADDEPPAGSRSLSALFDFDVPSSGQSAPPHSPTGADADEDDHRWVYVALAVGLLAALGILAKILWL